MQKEVIHKLLTEIIDEYCENKVEGENEKKIKSDKLLLLATREFHILKTCYKLKYPLQCAIMENDDSENKVKCLLFFIFISFCFKYSLFTLASWFYFHNIFLLSTLSALFRLSFLFLSFFLSLLFKFYNSTVSSFFLKEFCFFLFNFLFLFIIIFFFHFFLY